MQFVIGCIDGNTYKSKVVAESELQDAIDAENGHIGTGYMAQQQFTIDSMIETMEDIIEHAGGDKYDVATLTLEMDDGTRKFAARHIVWWEIIRDN